LADERKFNLLDEKWIFVMNKDGSREEISLLEIFKRAPELAGLAGELPTQDIAILRFLLAIMHGALARAISNEDDALDLWEEIWKAKHFPDEKIAEYLEKWRDRFNLFDETYPFYQVAGMTAGTEYKASKLNGELSESSNKMRLFPTRAESGSLTYPEAARWLFYANAFDDTSAKPKTKGAPSCGAGWLGKLGLIWADGDNLFETLMLNWVLLKDGQEPNPDSKPTWELETVHSGERVPITIPKGQAELLTTQSRRILLERSDEGVTGYKLLGGDFWDKANAFDEQMTLWTLTAESKKKAGAVPQYVPRRHDPSRQLWRDFGALAVKSDGSRRPGVVNWLANLNDNDILPQQIKFGIASVKYGDKDFFVEDAFSDSLRISVSLLDDSDEGWVDIVTGEVENTDKLSYYVGMLAKGIAQARGGSDEKNLKGIASSAKELAYFRMDIPFREWLALIDPGEYQNGEDKNPKIKEWRDKAYRIIDKLGEELIQKAGLKAIVGRNGSSAAKAYDDFQHKVYKLMKGDGHTNG
jgi:CRISPR system Cascade subunit CasA